MTKRSRHMTTLSVEPLDGPLGPQVRVTIGERPLLLSTREARTLSRWLLDAADLADLRVDEQCAHCHDDPPAGHVCPACGRSARDLP